MLSSVTLSLLVFSVKWSSFCGGTPFVWDEKRAKIAVTNAAWRKFLGHAILIWVYTIFLIVRLITNLHHGRIYEHSLCFLMLTATSIASALFANTAWKWKEISTLVNSSLDFFQQFQSSYVFKPYRDRPNGFENIMRLLAFYSVFYPFVVVSHFFRSPTSIMYIPSILPEKDIGLPVILPYGIVQVWMFWSGWSLYIFHVFVSLILIGNCIRIVNCEIKTSKKLTYLTSKILRQPDHICRIYRSLQILNIWCLEWMSDILLPIQFVLSRLCLLSNFLLVRYWKDLTVNYIFVFAFCSFMPMVLWFVVLDRSSEIFQKSNGCLNSWKYFPWKRAIDSECMGKFRRSCKPLRVEVGGFYLIRKSTILKFLRAIARSTFKLLMTFGPEYV